jgi:hypothetical protein
MRQPRLHATLNSFILKTVTLSLSLVCVLICPLLEDGDIVALLAETESALIVTKRYLRRLS